MKSSAANLDFAFPRASRLCKKIQRVYPQTYIVGGAVRDALLGVKSADVDIATEATPAQLKNLLAKLGESFYDVGEKFGTVGVQGGTEITTFRIDSQYGDARHPDSVKFVDTAEQDAARRDFTVNALYYDPGTKRLLDFYGGLRDLGKRVLRFVGKPTARIREDPLRMLRAVRFAATLGFTIGSADAAAVKKHAALIGQVPGQRIFLELNKIISSGSYLDGIKLLDKLGLLAAIFPEVERLKHVAQSRNYHAEGNVFKHTLAVLSQLKDAPPELRWAGFLHDLGKFGTGKKVVRNRRVHVSFYGHAHVGAGMVKGVAERLAFPAALRDDLVHLTSHHMDFTVTPTPADVESRLKWARDPRAESIVRLRIADSLGAKMTDTKGKFIPKDTSKLRAVIRQIRRDRKVISKEFVTGHDVMATLSIKPGERVGKILRAVALAQLDKKVGDRRSAMAFIKKLDIHRL